MNAQNALRHDEIHLVSFPAKKETALVSVNVARLNRVIFNLLKQEEYEKSPSCKWNMFARDGKGKLVKRTLGEFIEKGVSGVIRGFDSCMTIKDHAEMIEALELLEALYYVFKSKQATALDNVTPAMIQAMQARIQGDPAYYSASPDWIQSYKARQAAAFESKDVKLQRKLDFCKKVFGEEN